MNKRLQCRKLSTERSASATMCAIVLAVLAITMSVNGRAAPSPGVADGATPRRGATPRVRVRAASALSAEAEFRGTTYAPPDAACRYVLKFWGSLRDDMGAPLPTALLRAQVVTRGEPLAPVAPLDERARPMSHTSRSYVCRELPSDILLDDTGSEWRIQTDDAGAFCLRTCVRTDEVGVAITFEGSSYQTGSTVTLHADRAHGALYLAFDPEIQKADLDSPELPLAIRANGLLGEELQRARIAILDETGRAITTVPFEGNRVVRTRISTAQLGGVGPTRLEARLMGDNLPPVPNAIAAFDRTAHVELDILRARPEWFGAGVEVTLAARSKGGIVDGGVIEAQRRGALIGAAQVTANGTATLLLDATANEPAGPPVVFRYVSSAPFFIPGTSPTLELTARGSLRWSTATLLLLTAGVLLFALRNHPFTIVVRRPAPAIASTSQSTVGSSPTSRTPGTTGKRAGRIIDAHDGHAIAQATVEAIVPSFPSSHTGPTTARQTNDATVLAATASDATGAFSLELPGAVRGVQLRVRAAWHASVQCALPATGEPTVAMQTRRRALLDRLVTWARRHDPRVTTLEPTPEEVMHAHRQSPGSGAATSHDAERIEAWARAVQDAAFGPGSVGEEQEARVAALEPKPSGTSQG